MLAAVYFCSGVLSVITQSLFIREFLNTFYGNELIFGLFFFTWLLWVGAGAYTGSKLKEKITLKFFNIFVLVLPLLGFIQLNLVRFSRYFVPLATSELFPPLYIFLIIFLFSAPFCFTVGIIFPLGISYGKKGNLKKVAPYYIVDSLGSLTGGLLFSLLLIKFFSHAAVFNILAALYLITVLLAIPQKSKFFKTFAKIVLLFFILQALPLKSIDIFSYTEKLRWKKINPAFTVKENRHTPYQKLSIIKYRDQFSLLSNSKIISTLGLDSYYARLSALYMAQKPEAKNLLVIGTGAEGLLEKILNYRGINRIDYLRQDPEAMDLLKKYLNKKNRDILNSDKIYYHAVDGRRWVNDLPKKDYFDLVIVNTGEPSTALNNRYYTKDFYQKVETMMKKDGVLVTSLLSASNYLGWSAANYSASTYHTLGSVFSNIGVVPGDTNIFFASPQKEITLNWKALKQSYKNIDNNYRFYNPDKFKSLLPPRRVKKLRDKLSETKPPINSDLKPVTYYLNIILWSEFTSPGMSNFLKMLMENGKHLFIVIAAVFFLFRIYYAARHKEKREIIKFNAAMVVFLTGLTAMAAQLIILFSYQNFLGHVYKNIALFSSLFMGGLALGSYLSKKYFLNRKNNYKYLGLAEFIICLFLLFFAFYYSEIANLGPAATNLVLLSFTVFAGVSTGSIFPLGVELYNSAGGRVLSSTGLIDSTDHLGAACGALFAGTLLVPLTGVRFSLFFLAGISFLSAVTVFSKNLKLVKKFTGIYSFPYIKASYIMAGILTVLLLTTSVFKKTEPDEDRISDFPVENLVEGGRVEKISEPFKHYTVKSGEQLKYRILKTSKVAKNITGYNGPVNMLLILSADGNIVDIKVLSHSETPAYVKGKLAGYLQNFKEKNIFRDSFKQEDIEAITSATVTSEAIRKSVVKVKKNFTQPDTKEKPRTFAAKIIWWFIIITAGIIFYLFFPISLRYILLGISAVVLGFHFKYYFTLSGISNLLKVRGSTISGFSSWFILFTGAVIPGIFLGQFYCGYICPVGAVQEFISVLGKKLGISVIPGEKIDRKMRYIKYIILFLILAVLFAGSINISGFNPLQYFFGVKNALGKRVLFGSILFFSLFFFRFWCRYLCPAGALLSLLNKISILDLKQKKRRPAGCDLGVKSQRDIDCIRCNRCLKK
ncbi:MAG: 4Fe-4S binding protein [Elusimicrobiota bacterium]